MKALHLSF